MINLDKQFSIILEKFKLIENSLNNMNNIDSNELIKLNREYSELRPIVEKIQEYNNLQKDILNLNELVKDNDLEISKIAESELLEKKTICRRGAHGRDRSCCKTFQRILWYGQCRCQCTRWCSSSI